jgi:hypothetical protein
MKVSFRTGKGAVDFVGIREDNSPRSQEARLLHFLLGIVLALLPQQYRSRLSWAYVSSAAAVTSGTLELLVSLGVLLYRYVVFANDHIFGGSAQAMLGAAEKGGETAIMGTGLFTLAEYAIQPLTLLLAFFVIEGMARLAAGLVTGEVVPTLPLQLVAWAHYRATVVKHERDLGPPVEDLVQRGAGEFALVIASCRPKAWTNMSTISYDENFYELVREETAQPPRQWVYVLRRKPEGKIIRGAVHEYRVDEAIPVQPAKT